MPYIWEAEGGVTWVPDETYLKNPGVGALVPAEVFVPSEPRTVFDPLLGETGYTGRVGGPGYIDPIPWTPAPVAQETIPQALTIKEEAMTYPYDPSDYQGLNVSGPVLPAGTEITQAGIGTAVVKIAPYVPILLGLFAQRLIVPAVSIMRSVLGNSWVRITTLLVGTGVISGELSDWLVTSGPAVDKGRRRKRRRYSIGANPRLMTLIKVGKFTDKLTRRFVDRARHAGVLKVPRRTQYVPFRHHHRH